MFDKLERLFQRFTATFGEQTSRISRRESAHASGSLKWLSWLSTEAPTGMHARTHAHCFYCHTVNKKKVYAKMESRTLFPKKLENNAIFRTAVCFRRVRLSSKKGKIVNLQAVIARVRGNDALSHARTHTHTAF